MLRRDQRNNQQLSATSDTLYKPIDAQHSVHYEQHPTRASHGLPRASATVKNIDEGLLTVVQEEDEIRQNLELKHTIKISNH
jgi:hypothetical protein